MFSEQISSKYLSRNHVWTVQNREHVLTGRGLTGNLRSRVNVDLCFILLPPPVNQCSKLFTLRSMYTIILIAQSRFYNWVIGYREPICGARNMNACVPRTCSENISPGICNENISERALRLHVDDEMDAGHTEQSLVSCCILQSYSDLFCHSQYGTFFGKSSTINWWANGRRRLHWFFTQFDCSLPILTELY